MNADDSSWRDNCRLRSRQTEADLCLLARASRPGKLREDNMEAYVDLVAVLAAAAGDPGCDARENLRRGEGSGPQGTSRRGGLRRRRREDDSPSIADQLVRQVVELVAAQQVTLGHTEDGAGYARCPVDNEQPRNLPDRRHAFPELAATALLRDTRKSLREDALDQAVNTIAAIAETDGETIDRLFVRVAAHDGKHYLDLGTPDWSAIEIGPGLGRTAVAGRSCRPLRSGSSGRPRCGRCRCRCPAARLRSCARSSTFPVATTTTTMASCCRSGTASDRSIRTVRLDPARGGAMERGEVDLVERAAPAGGPQPCRPACPAGHRP